jgi:hypothetical protein
MSLETSIMEQLKEAMKAKDEAKLRALRAIKAGILLAKTSEGGGGTLSEEDGWKMLQKMVKQRKDSYEIFVQQGRNDLAQKEKEELDVIGSFLPQPLDAEGLRLALQSIIAELGASSAADLGKVMGVATKQLAGRAEGKEIITMAKELLTA